MNNTDQLTPFQQTTFQKKVQPNLSKLGPDVRPGGTYDWNYFPKLVNGSIEDKLAVLRRVGI